MSTNRRGLLRANTPEFEAALDRAWQDAHTPPEGGEPAPKPLCDNRPAEFVDYHVPPTPEEAVELCEGCPLLLACRRNARLMKPKWGVWAGETWVDGKRLLPIAPVQELVDKSVA